jgi:hypothetical protein
MDRANPSTSLRGAKRRSNPALAPRKRKLDCFASLAMTNSKARAASQILPDGQISQNLSSPLCKNISVFPKCKSGYMICRPVPLEGRFAIVTDAGRDAVDADAPITNGAEADGEDVWS